MTRRDSRDEVQHCLSVINYHLNKLCREPAHHAPCISSPCPKDVFDSPESKNWLPHLGICLVGLGTSTRAVWNLVEYNIGLLTPHYCVVRLVVAMVQLILFLLQWTFDWFPHSHYSLLDLHGIKRHLADRTTHTKITTTNIYRVMPVMAKYCFCKILTSYNKYKRNNS